MKCYSISILSFVQELISTVSSASIGELLPTVVTGWFQQSPRLLSESPCPLLSLELRGPANESMMATKNVSRSWLRQEFQCHSTSILMVRRRADLNTMNALGLSVQQHVIKISKTWFSDCQIPVSFELWCNWTVTFRYSGIDIEPRRLE